jgi:hypothetical protein
LTHRHAQDFRLGDNEEDEDGHRINNPSDYGSQADFHEIPGYINVGIVPTTDGAVKSAQLSTGRIIAFPDWLQVGACCPWESFCDAS